MGLFSGSKKTYVASSVIRVIEEADVPNSVQQGIIRALHADSDLLESITENLFQSIGIKVEKFYKYGETKFVYGNPSGEFLSDQIAFKQVETILKRETGETNLQVHYAKFGPHNLQHFISQKMVNEYGYDTKTNIIHGLSEAPDIPAYLTEIRHSLNIFEMGRLGMAQSALDLWEPAWVFSGVGEPVIDFTKPIDFGHSPLIYRGGSTPFALLTYEIISDAKIKRGLLEWPERYEKKSLEIPLEGFDVEHDYFQVSYSVNGRRFYWTYRYGAGTYPELDGYFENPDNRKYFGEFYPSAYFRVNKVDLIDQKDSPEYKSNKALVKRLGLDYDFIAEAIKDSGDDLGDVEFAYMTLGIPPVSDYPIDNEYLFRFFDKLYEYQDYKGGDPRLSTFLDLRYEYTRDDRPELHNAIDIQDKKFRSMLGNRGIFKKILTGTIGSIGTYLSRSEEFFDYIETHDEETNTTTKFPIKRTKYIYQWQAGTGVYEEITVFDIEYKYFIWGTLGTVGREENEIHLIPLERSIVESMNVRKREYLAASALHLFFHSRKTIKEKWYQSGFFSFIIHAIAFVAFAWAFKPILIGINALVSAGFITTFQALVMVGKALLSGLLISFAIKLTVQVLGIELSIVAAVLLAALSLYQGVFGAGKNIFMLSAEQLLNASLGIVKRVGESVQDALQLLTQEYSDFLQYAEEQMKLLEETNDLLRPSSILSPFVYLGESAEDFYNRTIHSGNVGIIAIEAQSHFVDQALQLPTFKDTLGGFKYAL